MALLDTTAVSERIKEQTLIKNYIMTDGRKNNGGHSTKGFAGRKKKADQVNILPIEWVE